MRKKANKIIVLFALSILMSSCYTQKYTVGEGSQTGVETKEKNNYFLMGLIDGNVSDTKEMANGAENYDVTTELTFLDGFLFAITFGIYTPTTTVVKQ